MGTLQFLFIVFHQNTETHECVSVWYASWSTDDFIFFNIYIILDLSEWRDNLYKGVHFSENDTHDYVNQVLAFWYFLLMLYLAG